jgi:hypothetical protein
LPDADSKAGAEWKKGWFTQQGRCRDQDCLKKNTPDHFEGVLE